MKILIEVHGGVVTNVWCSEPQGAEVYVRDLDDLEYDEMRDDILDEPGLNELRAPQFIIY